MFGGKPKKLDEEKLMRKLAEELGGYPTREYLAYVPKEKTSTTPTSTELTIPVSNKRALIMLRFGIVKGWI